MPLSARIRVASDSPRELSTPLRGFGRPSCQRSMPKYVVSCEMRLISRTPLRTSASASRTTDSWVRLRCRPRIFGMMQNEHG